MWKSQTTIAKTTAAKPVDDDDDWDNADFENDVSSKESRWGSKAIEGSGRKQDPIDIAAVQKETVQSHEKVVADEYQKKGTFAFGYGGAYGVHQHKDKNAATFDEPPPERKDHASVPKYQAPTTNAGQNASVRSRFEAFGKSAESDKAQQDKVAAERAARAEKEKAERAAAKEEADRMEAIRKQKEREDAEEEAAQKAAAAAAAAAAAPAPAPAAEEQDWPEEPAAAPQEEEPQQQEQEQDWGSEQQEEQPQEQTQQEEAAAGPWATAAYEYEAAGEDELGFQEGEVIINIEFIDEGWWRGTSQSTGKYGLFPANYVVRGDE